jgi:hypothetical protein
MRFFTARRLALAAMLPVLFSFTMIPGCSEQSEGERCGDTLGPNNSDCQSGLTCMPINTSTGIYRCCNPTRVTNTRCIPEVSTGTTSEAGSAGDTGSTGGTSGDMSGGTSGDSAGQASTMTDAGAGG